MPRKRKPPEERKPTDYLAKIAVNRDRRPSLVTLEPKLLAANNLV
jgi:hypothetical protein